VLPGRSRIRIDFQVVDIRRALISVGKLVENDYTLEFGKNGGELRTRGDDVQAPGGVVEARGGVS